MAHFWESYKWVETDLLGQTVAEKLMQACQRLFIFHRWSLGSSLFDKRFPIYFFFILENYTYCPIEESILICYCGIVMALEDICGFKYTPAYRKVFTDAFFKETTSCPVTDFYSLQTEKLRNSGRDSATPLHFFVPTVPNSMAISCRPSSYNSLAVRRPFSLSHGTTTLAFIFQGGIIAAADTRASAGGLVANPDIQKISPVHSHLVVTSSGSGADCMQWERLLAREIRLYQLRHRRRLSIQGTAKLLSFMLHPFKGTDVCVALILCGWDKHVGTTDSANRADLSRISGDSSSPAGHSITVSPACHIRGPKLIYVCSDGARLQGDIFSVGSGSPYAVSVLDVGLRWSLSKEEAIALAREAVFRATHRDAYSGNNVDIFHVTAQGWSQREREDLKEEYYREKKRKMMIVGQRKRLTELDFAV